MNNVTPFHSSVGGGLLGAAASAKLALTGRVLGISGIFRGLLRGNTEPWRLSFLGGLASSGLIASYIYPSAFQTISYSYQRAALSGLLVGVGSSVGNGCTSGHGICGNARLSLRSLVYTCVFMVAGIVTSTLTKTAEALGVSGSPDVFIPSSDFMWTTTAFGIASLTALFLPAALKTLQKKSPPVIKKENGFLDCMAEFISGGVFGSALCLSGMTLPSKVASFLTPFSPTFDPSLLFVMGSALLIATPAFYFILKHKKTKMENPVCSIRFQIPTNKQIDPKLLIGSVLFGAGWGLGGICPGPALVSLMHPSSKLAIYIVFLCLGFGFDSAREKFASQKAAAIN